MFDLKKRVILITYLGLIPFYFNTLVDFFGLENLLHQKFNLKEIHLTYGAIIVAFLSGMQWQKMINNKMKNQLYIPLIPLIIVISYDTNFFYNSSMFIIILSLLLSLLIDLFFLKKTHELWFQKLRINVTILASLSYLI